MVALSIVKESNARLHELGPGLVALFVGGTSGIGEYTAKAFVQHANKPRVYLIGRSQQAADRIIEECKTLNKDGTVDFIKADVSELGEVDRACKEIQSREKNINLLFQTQGNFNLRGRDESPEGLDRKFSLNFYSRMRFIHNLLPQLKNASSAFSRSVSLLSAGTERPIDVDDLGLTKAKNQSALSFGTSVADHSIVMNDFMAEEFSAREPSTTFIHNFPGGVNTGLARELPMWARVAIKGFMVLATPFLVSPEETGQRQLFHATSGIFPPKSPVGTSGVSPGPSSEIADGADGKTASGAYLLNWNGETIRQKELLKQYRKQGYGKTIWEHTQNCFTRVEKLNRAA